MNDANTPALVPGQSTYYASGQGPSYSFLIGTAEPAYPFRKRGYTARWNVTAMAGTSPTLTPVIQGSSNGTTWETISSLNQPGSDVTAIGEFVMVFDPTPWPWIRASYGIGGTAPSVTMDCWPNILANRGPG